MEFTVKIVVNGAKATLEEMPFLAEGCEGIIKFAFTFDESWQGFSRCALLVREGLPMLELAVDESGSAYLSTVYAASDAPFYLTVEGTSGDCRLRTNSICIGVNAGVTGDAELLQYDGENPITENGTAVTKNRLFDSDLSVSVYTVDTSSDTVTPETLLSGTTAHDASGQAITGVYVAPKELPDVTEEDNGKCLVAENGSWTVGNAALPVVTEEDNGKIPYVVDGAWEILPCPSGTQFDLQTFTLLAEDWTGSTAPYTLEYAYRKMKEDLQVEVALSPNAEKIAEAARCGVYCSGQSAGYLTFTALYDLPLTDIDMLVRIAKPKGLSYSVDEESMTLTVQEV